ncbi:hypothetical protein CYMTET_51197 [Cymbomonas tetramitiformis]|uniref:Uncharacterized protein n=1 Tax=Cymbomonas tetramitiformis TaxID=36881 RepID=A0AAE0BMR6_9CHLO|nr:hypothetical protein CYMTET_51197 [Cymbomonas tetramitiformis]
MLAKSTSGIFNEGAKVGAALLGAALRNINLKPPLRPEILHTVREALAGSSKIREFAIRVEAVVPPFLLQPLFQLARTRVSAARATGSVAAPSVRPQVIAKHPQPYLTRVTRTTACGFIPSDAQRPRRSAAHQHVQLGYEIPFMPAGDCYAERRSYGRCRGCQYSTHVQSLNKLYDEGMHAPQPCGRPHLLFSECLMASPQLLVTCLRAVDAASGRPLEWTTILPTHRTKRANRYFDRLVGAAAAFTFGLAAVAPAAVALTGDHEEPAGAEEGICAATAPLPRALHPEPAR